MIWIAPSEKDSSNSSLERKLWDSAEQRDAGLLGRETKGEVVLFPRLRAALEKLNPKLSGEVMDQGEAGAVTGRCAFGWGSSCRRRRRMCRD